MNTLTLHIEQLGITPAEAARRAGIKYPTVWRHCNGSRPISAEDAVKYERGLNIDRAALRPDLWERTVAQEPVALLSHNTNS